MGSMCYWCWRCLGAVEPYRTWKGDAHRCPACHARVLQISVATLRFFSFLGDEATPEERLRRARHGAGRAAGSRSRQGAYTAEAGPSGSRSRYEWRFTWEAAGTNGQRADREPPRARAMTRTEALDLLELDDFAGEAEVRAAYRRLAKRHHPDVQATAELRLRSERMMARLNAAYRCLVR